MIFTGKTWRLKCKTCGAPFPPPSFNIEEERGKVFAYCSHLGSGAPAQVVFQHEGAPDDTLVPHARLGEYLNWRAR